MSLSERAAAWGIQRSYRDSSKRMTRVPEATVAALLHAMGAETDTPPESPVTTVRGGTQERVPGAVEVVTESEETVVLEREVLPASLPLGYHRIVWRDGRPSTRLIVSPGRCHLPDGLRTWGWALQLYSLRSRSSWGTGDLSDLHRFMEWGSGLGAGMTMVNPLHAPAPGAPQQASPYFPSSRCWRNPLYLAIEGVPGAAELGEDLERLRSEGRSLNLDPRINRDAVLRLKMEALVTIWRRGGAPRECEDFLSRTGRSLERFATYMALADVFGGDFRAWPLELRHPDNAATTAWRTVNRERVRFHSWVQWLLDRQLARVAEQGGLVQDLAIGVDPSGADAWMWQDVMPYGVSVGAPPDAFSARGQDWGVLAFDPWRLRSAEYEPFIQTIRWSLASAGGLRLDHVMGLWRLFWVPEGTSAADGTYVRYPAEDLLDILALESRRAEAFVVGEDLGTVEDEVHEEMDARDLLSYKLLWFESDPPSSFPRKALAAVTNHDLPTIAGLWSGDDGRAQAAMGLDPSAHAHEIVRQRLCAMLGVAGDASIGEVVEATYLTLAQAPCALLAATLEDALEIRERPNHPGTTTEWPNWSLSLPLLLEDIEEHPRARAIARALRARSARA